MNEELRQNDEKIMKLVSFLRQQRSELTLLIEDQKSKKDQIEKAIEKLSRKLLILTKSLAQRQQVIFNYDNTIKEIEGNYKNLVGKSGELLQHLCRGHKELEKIMNTEIDNVTLVEMNHCKEVEKKANDTTPADETQTVAKKVSPGKELQELLGGIEGFPFRILETRKKQSFENEKKFKRDEITRQLILGNQKLYNLRKIEAINEDNTQLAKSPSDETATKKTRRISFEDEIMAEHKKIPEDRKYNSVFSTRILESEKNKNSRSNSIENQTCKRNQAPKPKSIIHTNNYNNREEKRLPPATNPINNGIRIKNMNQIETSDIKNLEKKNFQSGCAGENMKTTRNTNTNRRRPNTSKAEETRSQSSKASSLKKHKLSREIKETLLNLAQIKNAGDARSAFEGNKTKANKFKIKNKGPPLRLSR